MLDELSVQAGVEVRFFTKVIDADADPASGKIHGIITTSVEGYRCIRAKTFIDCTGDAVLAGSRARRTARPGGIRSISCRPRCRGSSRGWTGPSPL